MQSPTSFYDDPDRPRWNKDTVAYGTHHYYRPDGSYAYTTERGLNPGDDKKRLRTIRQWRGSFSDLDNALKDDPELRRNGAGAYWNSRNGEKPQLYRLRELIETTKDRGP